MLNLGTSAQLAQLTEPHFRPEKKSESSVQSVDYFPYRADTGQYLLVAASLNGGNVLRAFTTFLAGTVRQLTGVMLSEPDIWNRLIELDRQQNSNPADLQRVATSLRIKPTPFGERHQPETFCSVDGIRSLPPTLVELTRCLCVSLLDNLFEMAPLVVDTIPAGSTVEIVCTGSVMAQNPILRRSLDSIVAQRFAAGSDHHHLLIDCIGMSDADVGCALLAHQTLSQVRGE